MIGYYLKRNDNGHIYRSYQRTQTKTPKEKDREKERKKDHFKGREAFKDKHQHLRRLDMFFFRLFVVFVFLQPET